MRHILLTGAGFSKNWGGWLASEAFEYLLGSSMVDEHLRRRIWTAKAKKQGFEDVLATLQFEHRVHWHAQVEQDLRNLTSAVTAMFAEMAAGYANVQLDSPYDSAWKVRTFLASFDAIYTLNQDTLLEQKYMGLLAGTGFRNCAILGLVPSKEMLSISNREYRVYVPDKSPFTASGGFQPYYKLHGSFNWINEREVMLIIGGDKSDTIKSHPLLSWYFERFRADLTTSDTRLMVVGYSFGDSHINEVIGQAVETGNKLFLIDPHGTDVIDKNEPRNQQYPIPLVQRLQNGVIGASRRPFRETFDKDEIEYAKVMKFFC